MNKTFVASCALIGTIIGAGFLGIPYVVMQSGFGIGLLIMLIVFAAMVITKLYLGEIALRTKTTHQVTGYAEKYLGKKGKVLMFIATIFGIYSAILAYLIAEGESLSFIFFGHVGYQFYFGLTFWLVLSCIVFFGIRALKKGEAIGVILIFVMVIAIAVLSWDKIDTSNLNYNNWDNVYVPFGVILFAFLGYSAIPEVRRIIGEEGEIMKRTIWTANIVSFAVYVLFTFVVLGTLGINTPQLATLSLGKVFVLLGMITIFTSYLALSVALIDTLRFDFGFNKVKSWVWTIIVPLVLYSLLELTKNADFIRVLGVGGVLSGGLTAILIIFMLRNAKKNGRRRPEYSMPYWPVLNWILIALFVLGAILEIYNAIK
jgi:amino acid permease